MNLLGRRRHGKESIDFIRPKARQAVPPGESLPAVAETCRLAVKAVPNAPRNAVTGWAGNTLKVKVHAPALDGRANEALCDFLAEALGLRRNAVTLVQGAKSRLKLLKVTGLSLDQAKARLSGPGSAG